MLSGSFEPVRFGMTDTALLFLMSLRFNVEKGRVEQIDDA
jgi:hypothetical protein